MHYEHICITSYGYQGVLLQGIIASLKLSLLMAQSLRFTCSSLTFAWFQNFINSYVLKAYNPKRFTAPHPSCGSCGYVLHQVQSFEDAPHEPGNADACFDRNKKKDLVVKGDMPGITPGSMLLVHGVWDNNKDYGWQVR